MHNFKGSEDASLFTYILKRACKAQLLRTCRKWNSFSTVSANPKTQKEARGPTSYEGVLTCRDEGLKPRGQEGLDALNISIFS